MSPYKKHSINIRAFLEFGGFSLCTETNNTKTSDKGKRNVNSNVRIVFFSFKLPRVEFNYIPGKGKF